MYSFQSFTDYSNNIVLISAEDSAILSIILSLFGMIFTAMSFSIAIRISDSKLFWVSEVLSLVFNSLGLEKQLSHVHCVTLSVTMNLYAAYKFSYAAANNLYVSILCYLVGFLILDIVSFFSFEYHFYACSQTSLNRVLLSGKV